MMKQPIGIFDSGYGGLTVLKEIYAIMPDYDFIYLGDNARAPYGPLSFETVYKYTLESVEWFFKQGCPLVILACNTASAKALRSIQQNDLPKLGLEKRVLGVIRPTSEIINNYTTTNHIGILATAGTVLSESYKMEIAKFHPQISVVQHACLQWVNMVEQNNYENEQASIIIHNDLHKLFKQDKNIDCILLACTHYPLLIEKIKVHLGENITLVSQGKIVADSLVKYLKSHTEIDNNCKKDGEINFFTTGNLTDFNKHAAAFFGKEVNARQITLQ